MNFPKPTLSRNKAMELWISERSEYAKEQVVLNNVRLVGYVLKSLNLNVQDEDLYATGIFGLVKAVIRFDFSKGAKFQTFATRVIQNEILMTFRKKRITSLVYLDKPFDLGSGDESALLDMIADETDYETEIISKISVENVLAKLTDRESQILLMYANENRTQAEIAKEVGTTQSGVSRIIKKIRKKLEKEFDY